VFTALRHLTHTKSPPIGNLLSHAALVFNYFSRTDFFSINPVLWSLAVEMQFYLLMPLLILLIVALCRAAPGRAALAVPLVFIGIGIVSRTIEVIFVNPAATAQDLVRYRSVFSFLDCFGMGMLVAYIQQTRTRLLQIAGLGRVVVPVIGILFLVIASDWGLYAANGAWLTAANPVYTICAPLLICIGVALLLYSALNIGGVARGLSTKALTLAGTISYSIYLYHVGVQVIIGHYVKIGPQLSYQEKAFSYAAISLIPTLALAALVYWAVERPSLLWAAKWKEQAR
jgi:peptidoglycan/LPS O-acetylase OafA/YrhL